MIHSVLDIITGELNNYLKRQLEDPRDKAVVSALVDQSGGIAVSADEVVIATLFNVEQERSNLNMKMPRVAYKTNPPIQLNLYVLYTAYFPRNYNEALKFLGLVIRFFQGKQVFTPNDTPGLPDEVEKIAIEIHNLDQHNLSMLWGTLGAKYMPSVAMKIRMISITRDTILEEVSEITSVETNAKA